VVAAAQGPAAKFASKKSKAAAKTGGAKYQWQIMLDLDIPPSEIERFR
jgi:leucyl-tRNA synthetase